MKRFVVLLAACSPHAVTPPSAEPPPEPASAPVTVPVEKEEIVELTVLHSFPGIDFLASTNNAIHTHGGPAAQIDDVVLQFDVHDRRTHEIEVKHLDFVSRSCNSDHWTTRKPLLVLRHEVFTTTVVATGRVSVTIPAGTPRRYFVKVGFPTVEAYQACDIFGFDVDLIVDRVRAKFIVPLDVTREEPTP